jgi:hypothetical protein
MSSILRTIPLLIAVCLFNFPTFAQYGGGDGTTASAETNTYVFLPGQSTVVQTGGIAGVHETYPIQGQFQLKVDVNASFGYVDAFLLSPISSSPPQSLGELFDMTSLAGAFLDETTISFMGKTDDGSDVLITVTIEDDLAYLIGETIPPPNSADFFLFSLDGVAQRKYSGGTGEPNEPYQIATAEDLMLLGESPDDYDKHFILTADIDLNPNLPGRKVFDRAIVAPDVNEVDNYFQGTPFSGILDGKDHIISNMTIVGGEYIGLFGLMNSGAEIRDLGVVDVNITGSDSYVGGLVGSNNPGGDIVDCYSTGTIRGISFVGGLVGENTGYVTNCYSTGSIYGSSFIGGLVGSNGGNITRCYSSRAVSGTVSIVGGLAGANEGTITLCNSTGDVIGTKDIIGGLVGDNSYGGTVTNCYSTGSTHGEDGVGGLVGRNQQSSSVTNCYSTGVVSGTGSSVGGLVGSNGSGVIRCFWDTRTSGQINSAGGTGKTTGTMQIAGTFLDAGWDFVGETENGIHEVWQMPEEGGYPVLAILNGYTPPQLQGAGTREDPYIISDALELGAMCHYRLDAHYHLTHSIDFSGTHWAMAIVPWFAGTFDGNNHTIMNLNIDGGIHLGLFGRLTSSAKISNLGVVAANITGFGDYVAGLAGINNGTINHCYSNGSVSGGGGYIGGLVGDNYGSITTSYSTGTVSGRDGVGGLVGDNIRGNISHCYSMTSVVGSYMVGGLVGINEIDSATRTWRGHVSQCYSAGSVDGDSIVGGLVGYGGSIEYVTQCFWDTQASGRNGSDGGTGKTTAEMQTASTFLEAGWDFLDETFNGTDDIWWIDEGKDYPRLWWEP